VIGDAYRLCAFPILPDFLNLLKLLAAARLRLSPLEIFAQRQLEAGLARILFDGAAAGLLSCVWSVWHGERLVGR
jgi:hypothetical protein